MARSMNAAWVAAIGAGIMMMGVQTATLQKTTATAQKPAVQKTAPAPKIPMTSFTGCLRLDGDQYELTNVEGPQVEKGRSWKTGFIRKSTRNIEVVGASSSVRLREQIGHKVSVVGTRDGETHLKASSIKRVAAACT